MIAQVLSASFVLLVDQRCCLYHGRRRYVRGVGLDQEQPHSLKTGQHLVVRNVRAVRCAIVYIRSKVSKEDLKDVVDVDVNYTSFRSIRV
jgi:hypothetical protein